MVTKKKHIMTFTRPAALRKIAEIPGLLEKEGPMSKHDLAKRLGVVSRTAQTYLAELKRRDEIHIVHLAARTNGGTPVAVWANGSEPDGYVAPVLRAPADPNREDARTRRARRRAEAAASKQRKSTHTAITITCPWHVFFWNMVNVSRKNTDV